MKRREETRSPDKVFLAIVALLALGGLFVFTSAAFGLLSREGARFSSVLFNQIALGLVMGSILGYIAYRVPYKLFGRYALWIFVGALILSCLVFIPGLGLEHGGAKRWLLLGPISFQPIELLKLSFVLYFATWLASVRKEISSFKFTVLPLLIILGVVGTILLLQPDHDSLFILGMAGVIMLFAAGGRKRYLAAIGGVAILGLIFIIATQPYVRSRMLTFLDPSRDPLGASYQVRQSLVAIGSGQIVGKGFGQSVQKYEYLPEPIGDSIFAVLGEEFGFLGTMAVLGLFLVLALRGLRIATRAPDLFGRLVVLGIVIIMSIQSFLNMAAMLGIFPLTGAPLLFISHGGTALMFALIEVGIILNISKYEKSLVLSDN